MERPVEMPPSPPLSDPDGGNRVRDDHIATDGITVVKDENRSPRSGEQRSGRREEEEEESQETIPHSTQPGHKPMPENAPKPLKEESAPSAKTTTNFELEPDPDVEDDSNHPHSPNGPVSHYSSVYLEPPTPTQPLLELSPTPMTFPSHIHASSSSSSTATASPRTGSPVTSPPYWTAAASDYDPTKSYGGNGSSRLARPMSWASTDSVPTGGIMLCDNEAGAGDARNAACWAKGVLISDYTIVNGSSSIPGVLRPAVRRVGGSRPTSRSGGGAVHSVSFSGQSSSSPPPSSAFAAATKPSGLGVRAGSYDGGYSDGRSGLGSPGSLSPGDDSPYRRSLDTVSEYSYSSNSNGRQNGMSGMRATLGMGGIGAFVVFHVTIETLDGGKIELQRRYSEFDTLRSRLVATFPRFQGAMPPLPPKSFVSRFRPRFLEERRRGLEYFLSCVLLNPEFAGSPVTKEFIFARQ